MKIAIDLDGTAWAHREFFIEVINGLKSRGHEVGILTAHNFETFKDKDLALWKARGFPTPDFYIARVGEEHHMYIGEWKRNMVDKHGIDILFEDFGENNPDIEASYFEKPSKAIVLKVINKERYG